MGLGTARSRRSHRQTSRTWSWLGSSVPTNVAVSAIEATALVADKREVAITKGDMFRREAPTVAEYHLLLRGSKGPFRGPGARAALRARLRAWVACHLLGSVAASGPGFDSVLTATLIGMLT
jgi:hypothetical protein